MSLRLNCGVLLAIGSPPCNTVGSWVRDVTEVTLPLFLGRSLYDSPQENNLSLKHIAFVGF